jgi:hypothetical protein
LPLLALLQLCRLLLSAQQQRVQQGPALQVLPLLHQPRHGLHAAGHAAAVGHAVAVAACE